MRRFILLLCLLPLFAAALPTAPASAADSKRLCFAQVPDCIEFRFRTFWSGNGGLPVFGLPLTSDRNEKVGDQKIPNVVQVKWDAQTQFYLDNQPTTLDKIEQYMNVTVAGRMKDGEMVATEARFSSVLPANVRRAQN